MSSTTALPCWSSAELRCLQGTRLKTAAGVREEVFAVESTNNSAVLRVSSWVRVPFKVPVWISGVCRGLVRKALVAFAARNTCGLENLNRTA